MYAQPVARLHSTASWTHHESVQRRTGSQKLWLGHLARVGASQDKTTALHLAEARTSSSARITGLADERRCGIWPTLRRLRGGGRWVRYAHAEIMDNFAHATTMEDQQGGVHHVRGPSRNPTRGTFLACAAAARDPRCQQLKPLPKNGMCRRSVHCSACLCSAPACR
jgi:hypothetical protein